MSSTSSTSVAALTDTNALSQLTDTVKDSEEKKLFGTEMDTICALFSKILNNKAQRSTMSGPVLCLVEHHDLGSLEWFALLLLAWTAAIFRNAAFRNYQPLVYSRDRKSVV